VKLPNLTQERTEKRENSRQSKILKYIVICAGTGYQDIYWKLLNNGDGREEVRDSNRRGCNARSTV
jgi:hypothetical protein